MLTRMDRHADGGYIHCVRDNRQTTTELGIGPLGKDEDALFKNPAG